MYLFFFKIFKQILIVIEKKEWKKENDNKASTAEAATVIDVSRKREL